MNSSVRPEQQVRDATAYIDALLNANSWPARSLLVTVLGDAINPHGGSVWLGGLIRLAAPLRLNERLVRTAVYRLTREGWLCSRTRGRRSCYSLTPFATASFASADQRIYGTLSRAWDGRWRVVMLHDVLPPRVRDRLRRELLWRGFAALSSTTFAHPSADLETLTPVLHELDAGDAVTRLHADALSDDAAPLEQRFRRSAELTRIADEYRRFAAAFGPARALATPPPEAAFVLRTSLVHNYRRVILQDPALPPAMLPDSWPGFAARALTSELYGRWLAPSEEFLHEHAAGWDGPFTHAPSLADRLKTTGRRHAPT
ncbi:MAG: PaaX family transcriptional regulator C-terminal domain-containing protein [Pseudomonadota bacterium]